MEALATAAMKTCDHLFHDTTKRYLKTKTDKTKQTKRETATADRTGNVPSKANAYKQMLFTKPT